MVSSAASGGAGWIAAALGGCFLGCAIVCLIRALAFRKRGLSSEARRAVSRVFVFLSGVAASGAALLILPPKPLLREAALWIWSGAWALLGALAAAFPWWFGIPLVLASFTAIGLAGLEISAWHPLVPGREAARFVPYRVGESLSSGDFSVPDRNAVPVLSKITLEARECSLEARVLDLSGPLASFFGERRYFLVRLADSEGRELLKLPEKPGPLRAVLTDALAGVPGIRARSERSEALELRELVAVSWSFSADGKLERTPP